MVASFQPQFPSVCLYFLTLVMADEFEFAAVDAGASATFPMQCSALRKNGFVMIKVRKLRQRLAGISIFKGENGDILSRTGTPEKFNPEKSCRTNQHVCWVGTLPGNMPEVI